MRLGWAIALGIAAGGLLVWWLGRGDPAPGPAGDAASTGKAGTAHQGNAGPTLYRWRDDAGVLQLTDTPPRGRAYETVDIHTLERRNTFDPPRDTSPAQ